MATRKPPAKTEKSDIEAQAEALDLDMFNYMEDEGDGTMSASASEELGENVGVATGMHTFESAGGRLMTPPEGQDDFFKPDDTWRKLICMKMGKPNHRGVGKLYVWAPGGNQTIKFKPFGISPLLHPKYVESVLKIPENANRGRHGYYWQWFWPTPPKLQVDNSGNELKSGERGSCMGKMSFLDKVSGQKVNSCIYGNCPIHKQPQGIHHSIHQAQLFLARLKSDSVIRRYIKDFDPRPDVAHFATLVLTQRAKRLREQMGLGDDPDSLTF